MKKPSKYNNRKVELDGFAFDSQKEARRYTELKLLVRVGEISELDWLLYSWCYFWYLYWSDLVMSEFNKWQEDKALSDSEFYGAKEAWNHQQAKIDELSRKVKSNLEINKNLQNMLDKLIDERDELQSKVDEALNMLCKLQYSSGERIYNDVGNILKGNKDEN